MKKVMLVLGLLSLAALPACISCWGHKYKCQDDIREVRDMRKAERAAVKEAEKSIAVAKGKGMAAPAAIRPTTGYYGIGAGLRQQAAPAKAANKGQILGMNFGKKKAA